MMPPVRVLLMEMFPGFNITGNIGAAIVGVAYSAMFGHHGGTGPYTFSIVGSLPAWLSFTGSTLSGTPAGTDAGDVTIRVQLTDATRRPPIYRDYVLRVAALPLLLAGDVGDMTIGTPVSYSYTATGGTGGYVFTITSGALPVGISLSSGGALSGTPTTFESDSWVVTVTDSGSTSTTLADSCNVDYASLTLTGTLPVGEVGVAYNHSLTAHGGATPYTWSLISGTLPHGLSLDASTGLIGTTPILAETKAFTIGVQSADLQSTTSAQSVQIYAALSLTGTAPDADLGLAYTFTPALSGGHGTVVVTLNSGSLPSWASLNSSTGAVTGTPTGSPATDTFQLLATDALGGLSSLAVSINVHAGMSLSGTLGQAEVGFAYSSGLTASGGDGGNVWSVSSGSLPSWASLNTSTGVITNTSAVVAGSTSITLKVTDALGAFATSPQTLVAKAALALSGAAPAGDIGLAYSWTPTITGGVTPITWSVSAGSLPAGLSLNTSTGAVTGNPTTASTYTFTIHAVDAYGATASTSSQSVVIHAAVTLTGTYTAAGSNGVAYTSSLAIANGAGGYTNPLVASGTLPAGLSLSIVGSTLVLSGTPTTSTGYTFTVSCQDSLGQTATSGSQTVTIATSDPQFPHVKSLLHFNGANNSTSFVDQISGVTWAPDNITGGGPIISTGAAAFGSSSGLFSNNGGLRPNSGVGFALAADFTIDIQLKQNVNTGTYCTVFAESSSRGVFVESNKVVLYVGADRITSGSLSAGFHHVRLSRASNVMTLWVDGISQGTYTSGGTFTLSYVGNDPSEFAQANFDEFRITDTLARDASNFTPQSAPWPDS